MNQTFTLFIVLGFVAVVLLVEGLYVYWLDTKSPAVKRVENRLRALKSASVNSAGESLGQPRVLSTVTWLQQLLSGSERVQMIDRYLMQSGSTRDLGALLIHSCVGLLVGLLLSLWLALGGLPSLLATFALGLAPAANIVIKRRRRLAKIDAQLAGAMELMASAVRMGHALQSALAMVGDEGPEPLAGEFKRAAEEIGFGVAVESVLKNLALRVPSADINYFVMAALIQRQTGGKLSELLEILSGLIRDRFVLAAKVRVLSAEGKISAWILTLLPFCVAGLMSLANPVYLRVLFTTQTGLQLLAACFCMMSLGIFLMWRIVSIKI